MGGDDLLAGRNAGQSNSEQISAGEKGKRLKGERERIKASMTLRSHSCALTETC